MAKKLYVGSLPFSTNEEELKEVFVPFGTVESCRLITDKFTGRSKGFAFVEMSSDEEAQKAIEGVNGKELGGRTLVVSEARPERPRDDRGGGGYRGGGGGGGGGRRGGFGGGGGGRGGYGGGGGGGGRDRGHRNSW